MTEQQVVARIWRAVRRQYPTAWLLKVHGGAYQRSGVPDLLVCVDGLLVGIEVKERKPGESVLHARARATPGQLAEIAAINRAGGCAGVVLNPEEALDLIGSAVERRREG